MKISGIQKTSLIEYPGKIVSVLFTQGCNFRCPYCHNSELIGLESRDGEYFPLDSVYSFLEKRRGLIDGVSITGGEPTLQAGLYDFLAKIRKIGLNIKLDTNGSNPEFIKKILDDCLVDYIAMDVKGPLDRYDEITGSKVNTSHIFRSITLLKEAGIDYEFRTTFVPGIHAKSDLLEIVQLLKGSKRYFIQNFRPSNTFDPELMEVNGFPPSTLEEFKDIASSYIKNVEIRN